MSYEKFLREVSIKVVEEKYLLTYKEQYFYIGEILYAIILHKQENKGWEEIRRSLLNAYHIDLSVHELEEQFASKIKNISDRSESVQAGYVHGKITILSVEKVNLFAGVFSKLFKRGIFISTLMVSIAVTLTYFLLYKSTITYASLSKIDLKHFSYSVIYMYLFSVAVMIFHEIGHASASYRFKVQPGRIGFGFYMIFPVFFTDVSKIWSLKRNERIVVNIGGIYFQLIVNLILIFVLLVARGLPAPLSASLEMTVIVNTVIMIGCLNPFLRNDGYWIYSDLFSIPNLMEKALLAPVEMIRSGRTLASDKLYRKKNLPVMIYGTLNYLIIMMVMISIVNVLHNNYLKLEVMLSDKHSLYESFLNMNTIIDFGKISFSLLLIGIYFYKTINHFGRSFFKSQYFRSGTPGTNLLKL